MLDFLRRGMLIGLGLASITREKAEKIAEEMVKKGELTTAEAKEFIEKYYTVREETDEKTRYKLEYV